jgi:hypothetical protein
MKAFIFAFLLLIGAFASAEESLTVCGPNGRPACQLGRRVLQGLLVAQGNENFPANIDLRKLEAALHSQAIVLDRGQFEKLSEERQADTLYRNLMQLSGYTLPSLTSAPLTQSSESPTVQASLSTGTRGGGYDLSETSLPKNLWY